MVLVESVTSIGVSNYSPPQYARAQFTASPHPLSVIANLITWMSTELSNTYSPKQSAFKKSKIYVKDWCSGFWRTICFTLWISLTPLVSDGSTYVDDPNSTNLYVGNISISVNEDKLCKVNRVFVVIDSFS